MKKLPNIFSNEWSVPNEITEKHLLSKYISEARMKVHDNLPPNIRRIVNDVGGEVRLPEPVKHKEASIEELVSKVKTDAQTMNLIQKLLYKGKGMISK